MVVLLAAGAALSFGALAVTIRLALHPPLDAEAASLVTTFLAGALCVGLAVASGDFSGLDWADTWPFFVTGLFAPGISQILFTRAIGVIGASRTAVMVGVSPVLSAAIAVTILGEPLHVALVIGTLLVVAGGTLLVRERGGAAAMLSTLVIAIVVLLRPNGIVRVRQAFRPFLLSGLVYGVSYACLYSAFDRGRVTIVAPLVATESLWAVLISMVVLRHSERIGPRLLVASALVVGGGALISGFR